MFSQNQNTSMSHRWVFAVAALAAALILTDPTPGQVHLRFGYHGHHGHHGHHRYRSHHGHHGYHRYGRHHGYGHHAYRHARSRYYHHGYASPYRYRRSTARIIVAPRTTTGASDYPTTQALASDTQEHATASTVRDGWRLFEDGHYDRAFNAFARAAVAQPKNGEPKLGYALSAAMRGDDGQAAYAMRRVLKYEPDVLDRHAPVAQTIVQKLIERYEYQDTDDGRLMLQALKRLAQAQAPASSDQQHPPASEDPY